MVEKFRPSNPNFRNPNKEAVNAARIARKAERAQKQEAIALRREERAQFMSNYIDDLLSGRLKGYLNNYCELPKKVVLLEL